MILLAKIYMTQMVTTTQTVVLSTSIISIFIILSYYLITLKLRREAKDLYMQREELLNRTDKYYHMKRIEKIHNEVEDVDDEVEAVEEGVMAFDTRILEADADEKIDEFIYCYNRYKGFYQKTWRRLILSAAAATLILSILLWQISRGIGEQSTLMLIVPLLLIAFSLLYAYLGFESYKKWQSYNDDLIVKLESEDYENILKGINDLQRYNFKKTDPGPPSSIPDKINLVAIILLVAMSGYFIAGILGASTLVSIVIGVWVIGRVQGGGEKPWDM